LKLGLYIYIYIYDWREKYTLPPPKKKKLPPLFSFMPPNYEN
jgi:hypothetical protein